MPPDNTRAELRQISAITFLTFAARGFVIPFVGLYLKSLGFQGAEIGFLTSVSALVQLLLTPALHTLADRTGQHRRLYYGLLSGNILAPVAMVISGANKLLLGGSVVFRDAADMPSASLLSQLTLTWLDNHGRAIYGQLRAWGSFGWAVTTLISGRVYALGGYPLLFLLAGACNLILIPFARVLPRRTADRREYIGKLPPRSWAFYMLMASLFLFAFGNNAISWFSFIFFQGDLGASNDLIGVISSVAALSEIPAMILIDRLLRRTNTRVTLAIGMIGQAILWGGYALLVGPSFLIPLMIFRGTFYTFYNVSATLLVSRISHPANAATNQSIAQVTVPGLAVLIAGSINGWLFDAVGPRILFQIAALMALLATILLVAARRWIASQDDQMYALRQTESAV